MMKVRNMVRGGAVVALSLGLASVGTGMGLTTARTTPAASVVSGSAVAVPQLWLGRSCETVSDPGYGDSGVICGTLNGSDVTADTYWQMLVTFQSNSGPMDYISLMGAGVYDMTTGKDISTIGYTGVNVTGTSDYLSTPFFYALGIDKYQGYAEEPCIFWKNGGIGCVPWNIYTGTEGGI
ncbi:hypothetical protein [Ferrimicrobium acidiphilum]|uniref:hypothetical protein n=3 Tax=Ferrimicrobium acidiphilum TaxID=121039 RepID=UPI0023F26BFE|nr:hypothetical protein [Ferrimicrobium acidiphilum]